MFKTTQNRLLPALIITAFSIAALLAQAYSIRAQDTLTGAFQGTVFNNVSGVYLGGAAVDITSETTGVVYRLTSDSNGRFYQGLLSPGWYQINVSITGYKARLLRREIKVSVTGEIVPVPVALEPEAPGVVTPPPTAAEPAADIRTQINTSDARRDASYKSEELAALPLGGVTITRSFDELGLLAPGAAPPPQTIGDVAGPGVGPGVGSAGQFSVNGIRSRANNFTVDGSDNNDEDIGVRRQGFVALVPQPIESIQEFQIITLLAPAQFGRNIGGQVNAVSKGGGREVHGSLYGFFNSDKLNARNFFDSEGSPASIPVTTASGQTVLLDTQPMTVSNDAGGKDPLTAMQGGGTLGGPIVTNKLFYFLSGEYAKINAAREKHFAVPTVEERGPFRTGATGIFVDPFLSATNPNSRISAVPNDFLGSGLISVFPFANDPTGVYGANTFTQVLPNGGRGLTLSGRTDYNLAPGDRPQLFTVRYNFTDDKKDIPAVNEALFSSVLSKIRTHNLSTFLNSRLNSLNSETQLLNQFRFSIGRTHLNFAEIRDRQFMIPSLLFPNEPFLLNAPFRFNLTTPSAPGVANTGPVNYASTVPLAGTPVSTTAEDFFGGPLGQITVAGFSPIGTDVYNFPQDRKNTTLQFADGLTWQTGRHAVSVGADIRRTDLDSDLPRLSRTSLNFNGVPRLIDNGSGGFRFPTSADPNPIVRPADLLSFGAATNALLTLNVDRPDSKVKLRFYQFDFYGQDTWRVSPNFSVSFGLRYEYNSPVNEVDHLIENTFTDDRLSLVPGLNTFIDGRTHLYEPDRNNFAPRIGIAYSGNPFGPGRPSVIRVGYGLFYDQVLGAVANQSRNVFPTFLTFNFAAMSGTSLTALQYQNPSNTIYGTNQGVNVPVVTPGTINQFNPAMPFAEYLAFVRSNFPDAIGATLPDRNLEMPMAHQYSAVFEQQLTSNLTASIGYVGSTGRKLLRFTTPNNGAGQIATPTQSFPVQYRLQSGEVLPVVIPLGILNVPARRVSGVGAVNIFESTASSRFDSVQGELHGRFGERFNFNLSYVFSNVKDDVSDVFDLAGAYSLPQDSSELAAERGPANFDVRHRWTYDFVYAVPEIKSNAALKAIAQGLKFGGSGTYHSGQPFTVNSIIDVNLDGNLTDRLDSTSGIEVTGDRSQPIRLTGDPFTMLAPFGQNGSVGRNSFRAGSFMELDLTVIKTFSLGTARRLSFRADIFNFIDRANFGVPVRLLEAVGFGRVTSTLTPGRRVQLGVKFDF